MDNSHFHKVPTTAAIKQSIYFASEISHEFRKCVYNLFRLGLKYTVLWTKNQAPKYCVFMINFVGMILSNQHGYTFGVDGRERERVFFLLDTLKWNDFRIAKARGQWNTHTHTHFDNAVKINAQNWMEDTNAICIVQIFFIRQATNNTHTHTRTNTHCCCCCCCMCWMHTQKVDAS